MSKKRKISLDDLNKKVTEPESSTVKQPQAQSKPNPNSVKTVEISLDSLQKEGGLSEEERKARQAKVDEQPEIVTNLTDIAKAPEPTVAPEVRNQAMLYGRTDKAIERVKKDIKENVMEPMREKLIKQAEEKAIEDNEKLVATSKEEAKFDPLVKSVQLDDEEDEKLFEEAKVPGQDMKKELKETKIDLSAAVEEDDEMKELLKELEDDDDDEEEKVDLTKLNDEEKKAADEWEKKALEEYRHDVKNKLITSGRVEESHGELKVSSTPISISRALKNPNSAVTNTASFPLIHTGRMITMASLTGDEIPALDARSYNNELEAARAMYSLLYKKDVSPDKPATFEVWLKSIADWDILNMYMCLYIATFKDSNYISYTCPECHNMFIVEQPMEKMYRKHPDSTKDFDKRVEDIKNKVDNIGSVLTSKFTRISKDFAIGLRAPSIFASTFELAALDSQFRRKHIQCVNLSQYIDCVYRINGDVATPINFKVEQHNTTKTVKMKIISIEKIISTLTTDEAAALAGIIATFNQKSNDRYQFVIPEADCNGTYGPYKDENGEMMTGKACTNHIDEVTSDGNVEVGPLDLLFTRHRLTQFAFYEIEL